MKSSRMLSMVSMMTVATACGGASYDLGGDGGAAARADAGVVVDYDSGTWGAVGDASVPTDGGPECDDAGFAEGYACFDEAGSGDHDDGSSAFTDGGVVELDGGEGPGEDGTCVPLSPEAIGGAQAGTCAGAACGEPVTSTHPYDPAAYVGRWRSCASDPARPGWVGYELTADCSFYELFSTPNGSVVRGADIAQRGRTVFERYGAGEDAAWIELEYDDGHTTALRGFVQDCPHVMRLQAEKPGSAAQDFDRYP